MAITHLAGHLCMAPLCITARRVFVFDLQNKADAGLAMFWSISDYIGAAFDGPDAGHRAASVPAANKPAGAIRVAGSDFRTKLLRLASRLAGLPAADAAVATRAASELKWC